MAPLTFSEMSQASDEYVEEIIRLGEARLQTQATFAIAADQRAMSLTAASAALAAASAAIGADKFGDSGAKLLTAVALLSAIGFSISAALAAWTARPSPFKSVGIDPATFLADATSGYSLIDGKRRMAARIDSRLEQNRASMATNGKVIVAAMAVAALTPLAALLLAAIATWLFSGG